MVDPFPTIDAEEDIRRALDAGASGYLLNDSSQDDLNIPRSRTGGTLANCSGGQRHGPFRHARRLASLGLVANLASRPPSARSGS